MLPSVRPRRFFPRCLAMLFLATSLDAHSLAAAVTFEENRQPLAPPHYSWRNSSIQASLEAGGTVLFRSMDGRTARLTFPGAAITAEPRGEGPTVQKALYYIGPAKNWRSAPHFDRVRYAQVYPGIDLVFVTSSSQLEYNFE